MHLSTTPSLSQNIWPRWASIHFLILPIVQTLLTVTFGYSRGCRYETIEEMKESVTRVIDTLTQEDFHMAFQKLLERYNKCSAHRKKSQQTYRMHLVDLIYRRIVSWKMNKKKFPITTVTLCKFRILLKKTNKNQNPVLYWRSWTI